MGSTGYRIHNNTRTKPVLHFQLLSYQSASVIFVSLPDEGSRMLLKRCILFFEFTDAETENAKQYQRIIH